MAKLHFDKMFTDGYYRVIEFTGAQAQAGTVAPQPSMAWLILGGTMNHTTGTETILFLRTQQGTQEMQIGEVPSATATGTYPFPNMGSSNSTSQATLCFCVDSQHVDYSGGDNTTKHKLSVVEWSTSD